MVFLKKLLTIFFFALLISFAFAQSFSVEPVGSKKINDVDFTLVYNQDQCIADCEAWIEVDTTTSLTNFVTPAKENSEFGFDFVKAAPDVPDLEAFNVEVFQNFPKEIDTFCWVDANRPVPLADLNVLSCGKAGCFEGKDANNCLCVFQDRQPCGSETVDDWVRVSANFYGRTFSNGLKYLLHIVGKKKAGLGNAVDWQPTFFGETVDKWAWWDNDWNSAYPVNELSIVSDLNTGAPICLVDVNLMAFEIGCQDLNDVRVIDANTNTELERWIVGNIYSQDANVCFNMDAPVLTGDYNGLIKIYSGNNTCPAPPNDFNTYQWRDGYENGNFTNPLWELRTSGGGGIAPTVGAGGAKLGNFGFIHNPNNGNGYYYLKNQDINANYGFMSLNLWLRTTQATSNGHFYGSRVGGNVNDLKFEYSGDAFSVGYANAAGAQAAHTLSTAPVDNTWYLMRILYDNNMIRYSLYDNGENLLEQFVADFWDDATFDFLELGLFETAGQPGEMHNDEVTHRSLRPEEPSFVMGGVESYNITVFLPKDGTAYTSYDLNTVFKVFGGTCATYDVNVINRIAGYADLNLFQGTVSDDVNHIATYSYRNVDSNLHSLVVEARCDDTGTDFSGDSNFSIDNTPPVIEAYGFTDVNTGFTTDSDVNVYIRCSDTVSPTVDLHLVLNDANQIDGSFDQNSVQKNQVTIESGSNSFSVFCADEAGNVATDFNIVNLYRVEIIFINEETGSRFNLDDINGLVGYSPDNNNYFDFKAASVTQSFYVAENTDNLRFELIYLNPTTGLTEMVVRNFLLGAADLNSIPICVVDRDLPINTFYRHYLLSSTDNTEIALYNPFSKCYITTDNTRFIYQTNYINTVDLINKQYQLFVWVDGMKTVLGSVEGAVEATENIDALLYGIAQYTTTVTPDTIAISVPAGYTQTIKLYYRDITESNTQLNIKIYDANALLFNHTETSTPNDLNVLFDYSTFSISSNMLRAVVTRTFDDGSSETFTQYFTLEGVSSFFSLPPSMAIIVAILIVVFSLTLVSYRFALGWFGIIACVVGVGVLTMAEPVWYIVFGQAAMIAVAIYIALIYKSETVAVT